MKKIRDHLNRPGVTIALFILAAALLCGGAIGGARAALSKYSEYFDAQFEMKHIGVALLENDVQVTGNDALLQDLLEQTEDELIPGYLYDEVLSVENTGSIPQYVRVTVYKYWLQPEEEASGAKPSEVNYVKSSEMNSEWIELGFVEGDWKIDDEAPSTNEERTVLYHLDPLAPGEKSSPFMETIKVAHDVIYHVTQETTVENGVTTITTTFDYDGSKLCLVAYVDALQTHNAVDAATSAWGRDIVDVGVHVS